MKTLFVIGIGGNIFNANIEVHDVQLVISDSIENTYEVLKESWYGERMHLDEYKVLTGADGYSIQIEDYPQNTELSLFFVDMGGYCKEIFGEQHEYRFFVAENEKEAKEKAKKELLKNASDRHVDRIFKVESILKFADGTTTYIHLIQDGKFYNLKPDWSGYKKLI